MEEIRLRCPVSVIVPVFNSKPFLEKCIISLFDQRLKGIEYIFLDDNSDDGSLDELYTLVEKYQKDDCHVIIEHFVSHQGQAELRQIAKRMSSGDYIYHCDSDDWIDTDLIAEMYRTAVSGNYDIVTCDLRYVFEDGTSRIWNQKALTAKDLCSGIIKADYTGSLCNKLIRRDVLFKDIIQPTENMGEDWACSVQYAFYSRSVSYVDGFRYNYLRHKGTSSNSDDIEDVFIRHRRFTDNFGVVNTFIKNNDVGRKFHDDVVYRCLNLRFQLVPYIDRPEALALWKNTCPEYNNEILKLRNVLMKDKLIYILVSIGVYPCLKRILKRLIEHESND